MSVFVKPKLKALKEALAAKNWDGVQKNALGVLDFESNNYNARVFLALALFNLDKPDEAEETYKKAIELYPGQALGRQLWLGDADAAKSTLENAKEEVDGTVGGTAGDHLSVALARVYWAEQDEDRALAALMDSPDQFNKKTAPIFLKRVFQAIAIATNDTAILETSSKITLDADVKYDPGIARLNTLRHLAKGKPAPALFNTAKSLHAFPWATTARSNIAHLLATMHPVSTVAGAVSPSPTDFNDPENLEMIERLMRPSLPAGAGIEDAALRSRRGRLLGAVALAKGAEGAEENSLASEEQVQRWFDKALFVAPWDAKARQKWEAVRKVVGEA
ncbi:hypothetical protein JCM6882_006114 [Rhodosporidiobolus microsporus]